MTWDLEQALAIEAARQGEATGEATTVLRALPDETGRMAPGRLRRPGRYVAAALLVAAAAVGAVLLLATETGPGTRSNTARAKSPPSLRSIQLVAAHDYDPYGGDGEHTADTPKAIDHDPLSTWSTQLYSGGNLGKPGVGLYVDAGSKVHARRLDIRTPTPGFLVKVYGANVPETAGAGQNTFSDWGRPLASVTVTRRKKIYLPADAAPLRYYLIWIFKLPPGQDHAEIGTVRLFQ
jgi:serine/threonine-protein kinase